MLRGKGLLTPIQCSFVASFAALPDPAQFYLEVDSFSFQNDPVTPPKSFSRYRLFASEVELVFLWRCALAI